MESIYGFIPAAGIGSRMRGLPIIKELLPIRLSCKDGSGENDVVCLIENAIDTLIRGGAEGIVCVVNTEKGELVKGINKNFVYNRKIDVAYIYQEMNGTEYGVPYAIARAATFLRGKTVFMRFPDTIVIPQDCFQTLYSFHKSKNSQLTLGVFPTKHPERLGPVVIDEEGRVVCIEDKPSKPSARNTWNCIIWEDSFLDRVVSYVENERAVENKKELIISDVFKMFIEGGNRVYAYEFKDGHCYDISCVQDFKSIWDDKREVQV